MQCQGRVRQDNRFCVYSGNSEHKNKNKLLKMLMEDISDKGEPAGAVYGFRRVGTEYIKIGYVSGRKKASVEAAFEQRRKEFKRCGYQLDLKFFIPVPHAFRVEQLVLRHLAGRRYKEVPCNSGKVAGKRMSSGLTFGIWKLKRWCNAGYGG